LIVIFLSIQAIYSATASAHKKPSNRFIPSTADRVLDAPGLMNDYCNTPHFINETIHMINEIFLK